MSDDLNKPIKIEKSIPASSTEKLRHTSTETMRNPEVQESVREEEKERKEVLEEITKFEQSSSNSALAAQQQQKEEEKKIEYILEEGMEEFFLKMSPDKQQEFKIAGEQTAKEINKLLHMAKISVRKIISLIKKWLVLIPGINKFFLEQEAKIKVDEILKLKKE